MNVCEICAHAQEHGWFGLPAGETHCRRCHRTYRCGGVHCAGCCAHFSRLSAFGRHQRPAGVCLDPAACGLVDRFGVWGWPPPADGRAFPRGERAAAAADPFRVSL